MFLGPLKPLRRDPPVIYLVLRPWQNVLGIELGLLLGGFTLLVVFSGWTWGRYAVALLPVCLALVIVGFVRLFWRHRIRIDENGVYREQHSPGTRLLEEWPSADVLSVHVVPVSVRSWYGRQRRRTAVTVTFRNGDTWQLTAGTRPWQERHLARSLASIVKAPYCDLTIAGTSLIRPDRLRVIGERGESTEIAPEDPALQVRDTVPREFVLSPGAVRNGRQAVLTLTIDHLVLRRSGALAARTTTLPWRAVTVLGPDSVTGGLRIAHGRGDFVVGEGLRPETVRWLVAKLHAYLPDTEGA